MWFYFRNKPVLPCRIPAHSQVLALCPATLSLGTKPPGPLGLTPFRLLQKDWGCPLPGPGLAPEVGTASRCGGGGEQLVTWILGFWKAGLSSYFFCLLLSSPASCQSVKARKCLRSHLTLFHEARESGG